MSTSVKKKIFVGLSGGVDSSVSLALLKHDGHDVTGVYIKSWFPEWISCDWKEDRRDAMRACAHLGVPFVELDLEEVYKREVIDMMITEYRAGNTPNPDVACNREVKFGAFWKWAKEHGADMIATGHYAQIQEKDGRYYLIQGNDTEKDQSYFLWTLTRDDLSHIMFPVGHLEKSDVRKLAKKFNLLNAEKKDSQGICFLGKVDLKEFLSHYVDVSPGEVLNEEGKIIGKHSGSIFFTLGERHGFEITKKTPNDPPYYIVSKNVAKNILIVSQKTRPIAQKNGVMRITHVNQIVPWETGKVYTSQIRYHGKMHALRILKTDMDAGTAEVSFISDVPVVASGQSLVLYDGSICCGGGMVV